MSGLIHLVEMKILLLHNRYQQKGGEDHVFHEETELLRKNGHEVETLLFTNDAITGIKEKIKTGIRIFYNRRSARLLENKIKTFHPDIIHVHNFFPVASPAVFHVAGRKKIPVVATIHNYRLICPGAILYREGKTCERCVNAFFPWQGVLSSCYRNSMIQSFISGAMVAYHKFTGTWKNKVSAYIMLTNFAKNKFIDSSLGLSEEQLKIKPNFVPDKGYDYQKDNFFLFIGRLSPEKGIMTMLNSFAESGETLKIIGDGIMRDQVDAYADKYSNIHYEGFRDNVFIMQNLKKARALIFPSLWYEGFPITILEAFSAATPVIASDLGSMPEIVSDNLNGLIFKRGDKADLSLKVKRIVNDSVFASSLSLNARYSFENQYTPEVNYRQLIKIYNSLMN